MKWSRTDHELATLRTMGTVQKVLFLHTDIGLILYINTIKVFA